MMATDSERKEALEALSGALGRVLEIGIADLPPAAKDLATVRVTEGCRIQFTILMMPMELKCRMTSPDLTSGVELFSIETQLHSDDAPLH